MYNVNRHKLSMIIYKQLDRQERILQYFNVYRKTIYLLIYYVTLYFEHNYNIFHNNTELQVVLTDGAFSRGISIAISAAAIATNMYTLVRYVV